MTAHKVAVAGAVLCGLVAASRVVAESGGGRRGAGEAREAGLRHETGLRQVGMKILLGDQVLWEASRGDDGRADADVVWDFLKEARFRRGRDFAANASKIRQDEAGVSLKGDITVHVDYGGEETVRELTLKRVVTEEGERWVVPGELVDKWFWSRQIARRHAAHLKGVDEVDR